jgi:NAD(P)-dependent dehydrogenase (short-subunit alcohol dehydrogenase family)
MAMEPVVVVTGAAGGIGFEIVRHLLEELNGQVVAVDIVKGDLEQLAAAHAERLEVVVGDITDVGNKVLDNSRLRV